MVSAKQLYATLITELISFDPPAANSTYPGTQVRPELIYTNSQSIEGGD